MSFDLDKFLYEMDDNAPSDEKIEDKVNSEEPSNKDDLLEEYALFMDSGRHSSAYIIYKPRYYALKIKDELKNAKQEYDKIRFKGQQFSKFKDFYAFSNIREIFKDTTGVFGYMSINSGRVIGMPGTCNRSNEIREIAARDGFGKLMFIIALAKESPVMPSREYVSQTGYDYWRDFSSDVNIDKNKFDNEMGLHKKTNSDCKVYHDPILDKSFKTKEDNSIIIQPLLNRHRVFLNQMKNYFEKIGVDYIQTRIKDYIVDAGNYFFDEQIGDQGWYQSFDVEEED